MLITVTFCVIGEIYENMMKTRIIFKPTQNDMAAELIVLYNCHASETFK